MSVVEDVVSVKSEGCDGKVKNLTCYVVTVCFITEYDFSFKELWNIEADRHED